MSTELFFGVLASLILAAVIIVAMTTNEKGDIPHNKEDKDNR